VSEGGGGEGGALRCAPCSCGVARVCAVLICAARVHPRDSSGFIRLQRRPHARTLSIQPTESDQNSVRLWGVGVSRWRLTCDACARHTCDRQAPHNGQQPIAQTASARLRATLPTSPPSAPDAQHNSARERIHQRIHRGAPRRSMGSIAPLQRSRPQAALHGPSSLRAR